jgi:hypothetical protein
MRAPATSRRILDPARRSVALRIIALGALALTSGCTAMVFDRYAGRVMSDPIFMWLEDGEQPEIRVVWSRWNPAESDPFAENAARKSGNRLGMRPRLQGCRTVEVYVNDPTTPLRAGEKPVQHWAIDLNAPVLPDDRYPPCSILLTYRRLEGSRDFLLTAATREGVVAEFENGKRKPAWLLAMPFAFLLDVTGTGIVFFALVFML